MQGIYLTIALAPLAAAVIAGLFGKAIGRAGAHSVTILAVGLSCVLSFYVLYQFLFNGMTPFNGTVYTWLVSDGLTHERRFPDRPAVRHDDGGGDIRVLDGACLHHRLHAR